MYQNQLHFYKSFFLTLLIYFISIPNIFCQKESGKIFFKDKTTISGLCKIKGDDNIKFKKNKDSESITYDVKLIDKIEINEYGFFETYRYKAIKDENTSKWMKVMIVGKVNLYKKDAYMNYDSGISSSGFGGRIGTLGSGPVEHFYVSHEGNTEVFKITSLGDISRSFRKVASDFFKDCPVLEEKIKNKELKKEDIEQVVKFYNSKCGNTEIKSKN